jgi:hypothetical protein
MSTTRLRWALALVACLASACTSTSYMRATKPYAAAVAEGTEAFLGELAVAQATCQRRAEFGLARHLMEGSRDETVGWALHCQDIATAATAQRHATEVLAAYAQALAQLADGATYQGAGLGSAATAAGQLTARFVGKDSAEAAYVGALGPPLNQLAGFLLAQATSVELKRIIAESAPAVEAILKAMMAYVQATDAQLLVHQHEVEKLLADAEARLRTEPGKPEGTRKVPPLEALGFVREAAALRASLAASLEQQKALAVALTSLLAAEERLTRAGERDEEELGVVVQDAITAVEAIRDFANTRPPTE